MPSISKFVPIASVLLTLGTGLAVLRAGGYSLTLPATTPLPWVLLGAAAASGLVLWGAAKLRLVELARACIAQPRTPREVVDELADLAGIARGHGLLVAATDPRAKHHPLLRSAVHLLVRDADERLIRSSLESEADSTTRLVGGRRAMVAVACRVGAAALAIAGAVVAVYMGRVADSPWVLEGVPAIALLLTITGFFAWQAVAAPIAGLLYRRNAADEFAAAAAGLAAVAIRAGESADQARDRLKRLLPTAGPTDAARLPVRAAA